MNWNKYIIFVVLTILITLSWMGLESVLDGKIISQHSDTVIAFILAYFVTDRLYERLYK